MIIPAGTMLSFTWGCYSDHRTEGPFRVLKDLDKAAVHRDFVARYREIMPVLSAESKQAEWYWSWCNDIDEASDLKPQHFVAHLAREGYIEDVENAQLWSLGDYNLELEDVS